MFFSGTYFEATPNENTAMFALHALVFLVLGTISFYVFGKPALVSWLGTASSATLARERKLYQHCNNNLNG